MTYSLNINGHKDLAEGETIEAFADRIEAASRAALEAFQAAMGDLAGTVTSARCAITSSGFERYPDLLPKDDPATSP